MKQAKLFEVSPEQLRADLLAHNRSYVPRGLGRYGGYGYGAAANR